MNRGWYVVYLIMVIINTIMCIVNGFYINTWQYWVWLSILLMCWIAGASYRKKEN